MEQFALEFAAPVRRTLTVSELNQAIRTALEAEFFDVWVAGEISGCRHAVSGHYYFTLKDADAQVACVCFRSAHRFFKFKPQDGIAVVARGRIDVYETRGSYQLIVEWMEPQGHGALQLAFEQLKRKLAAEGLFDQSRKRRLPPVPRRIGIITSPRGAVIQDMLAILTRRFPGLHIRLYPVLVQGEGAAEDVCRGLEHFSRTRWADAVILARGGGSLEDLWTFNEEAAARAIAASLVPVVSAIGHETDLTIADFVADLRAPTPSAAAELIVPLRSDLLDRLSSAEGRALQAIRYRLAMMSRLLGRVALERPRMVLQRMIGRQAQRADEARFRLRDQVRQSLDQAGRRVRALEARLRPFDPSPRLARCQQRRLAAEDRLRQLITARSARSRARLDADAGMLAQLSPLAVLERGYAVVTAPSGVIVRDPSETLPGDRLDIRVAGGRFAARTAEDSPSPARTKPAPRRKPAREAPDA